MFYCFSLFLRYVFYCFLVTFTTNGKALKVDLVKSSMELDIKATGDNFTAKLKKSSFQLSGSLEKLTFKRFNFQWDFKDLETGNPLKNKKILKWINKTHSGSFDLKSTTPRKDGTQLMNGNMSINGVTVKTTFLCKFKQLNKGVRIDGVAQIDTQDFGLPIIRYLKLFKVSPHVTVRLKIITL